MTEREKMIEFGKKMAVIENQPFFYLASYPGIVATVYATTYNPGKAMKHFKGKVITFEKIEVE